MASQQVGPDRREGIVFEGGETVLCQEGRSDIVRARHGRNHGIVSPVTTVVLARQ